MFPLAKVAVHVMSTIGVSKVVNDIIRHNTTVTTTFDLVKVNVGGLVIGSMVAEQVAKHVEVNMNAAAEWWNKRSLDENKPNLDTTPVA